MSDVLRENTTFALNKVKAARNILDISYHDAAAAFCEKKHGHINSSDVYDLYCELAGDDNITDSPSEFAMFCREFASVGMLDFDDDRISGREVSSQPPKVAYLRNSFADKAYSVFSRSFNFVTAVYFSGFSEPCEEVYYERASHAMLPIYNSRDGTLMSLYKLLLKYDLRIVSACNVTMNDETVMRYALASKNLPPEMNGKFMDISVVLTDTKMCGTLLHSLELLGAEIIMMNSYPLDYTDDRYGLILQLDMSNSDINAMRLFLEGSRIRHDMIGSYNITNN